MTDADDVRVRQRTNPDTGSLIAIALSVIVGSVASSLTLEWARFEILQTGADLSSIHFVALMASTPLAVGIARRSHPSRLISGAHLASLIGIGLCATTLSPEVGVVLLASGLQLILANLLVVVWRSRARSIPSLLLAGVFAVHYNVDSTLNQNGLFAEIVQRWGTTAVAAASLALLASCALSVAACRATRDEPIPGEAGLTPGQVAGALLALGSLALLSLQESISSIWGIAVLGCLVVSVGVVSVGVVAAADRHRRDPANLPLDVRVLSATALAVSLSMLVSIASIEGLWTQQVSFARPGEWQRFLDLIVVLHAVPLVFIVVRSGRKWLAAGPFALALGATVALLTAAPDHSLNLIEFATREILLGWGITIVIGGSVALAVRSPGGKAIEAGGIGLLALLPIIERAAVDASVSAISPSLVDLEGGADVRPFLIFAIIGLVLIGTWWFVRESGRRPPSPQPTVPVRETTS